MAAVGEWHKKELQYAATSLSHIKKGASLVGFTGHGSARKHWTSFFIASQDFGGDWMTY